MSIYSLMAFNAAHDQVQKNTADSQAIQAKKVETQTAQEQLDLNKKLDLAKVSQANNENVLNNYVGNQLKDQITKQYKAKQDQLDATSGLQDIAQHKAQAQAQQAAGLANHLAANDPDVQAHIGSTIAGISATQGQGSQSATPPMSMADGSNQGTQPAPLPSIPGIAPVQGGASPQNVNAQITPQTGVPAPAAQPNTPDAMPQPQQAPQTETQAQQPTQQQGIDLSPVEQAFGMPKGSMWLNPATMKPEVNPIWKARIEKQQAAQANYDVNQPFREVQRQDRLEQQGTQLLTKQLSSRSGGIGLQDNKVNAAIHARQLIDQSYNPQTGQYDITQVPYGELAESVGSLLAGNSGSSEGRINSLKQKTAQGDINGAISYFTGKPSTATSQDAIKQLVGIIDRQGAVSEDLRDKYIEGIKKLPVFKQLDPDRSQALLDSNIGNSFKDYLKNSPDKIVAQKQATIPQQRPAGATHYSPSTGKFYDDQGNVVQ